MSRFWMNAKRQGECYECETEIEVGDRIVYDDSIHKAYCKDCGEELAGEDPQNKRSYLK